MKFTEADLFGVYVAPMSVMMVAAAVEQAKAVALNAQAEPERRRKLTTLSVSEEEKQAFAATAQSTNAAYDQAVANLD